MYYLFIIIYPSQILIKYVVILYMYTFNKCIYIYYINLKNHVTFEKLLLKIIIIIIIISYSYIIMIIITIIYYKFKLNFKLKFTVTLNVALLYIII